MSETGVRIFLNTLASRALGAFCGKALPAPEFGKRGLTEVERGPWCSYALTAGGCNKDP